MTKELRSVLKEVIYIEFENIEERLDELADKQKLELVIKLMPYVFLKIESASHTINESLDWGVD